LLIGSFSARRLAASLPAVGLWLIMRKMLPALVAQALGEDRVRRLSAARERLRQFIDEAPEETTWAVLVPMVGSSRPELDRRLRDASAVGREDWVYVSGTHYDGRAYALAPNLVGGSAPLDRVIQLQLFDLHPRMVGWYLTGLWRAGELSDELSDALASWHVVASAALGRSLLEGAFAFVAEAHEIAEKWATVKAGGPPNPLEARQLSRELGLVLAQAQWGTRIGERGLRRTKTMRLIERGARIGGLDIERVKEQYNWLCDAVHPSFGFQTAYTTRLLLHNSGAQAIVEARRRPPLRDTEDEQEPTVAIASVEAATIALEQLASALPRFLRTIDDFGLTTGVCFASRLQYWRRFDHPRRNDQCPCGSNKKFKACVHEWGAQVLV
jgi:hypothetical protein